MIQKWSIITYWVLQRPKRPSHKIFWALKARNLRKWFSIFVLDFLVSHGSTGSLTMKCAEVKAYINPSHWLSVSKSGFLASTTSGHLWKCKTNLSESNSSKDTPLFISLSPPYNKHITKRLFWNCEKSYKEVSHECQLLVICLYYCQGLLSQSW